MTDFMKTNSSRTTRHDPFVSDSFRSAESEILDRTATFNSRDVSLEKCKRIRMQDRIAIFGEATAEAKARFNPKGEFQESEKNLSLFGRVADASSVVENAMDVKDDYEDIDFSLPEPSISLEIKSVTMDKSDDEVKSPYSSEFKTERLEQPKNDYKICFFDDLDDGNAQETITVNLNDIADVETDLEWDSLTPEQADNALEDTSSAKKGWDPELKTIVTSEGVFEVDTQPFEKFEKVAAQIDSAKDMMATYVKELEADGVDMDIVLSIEEEEALSAPKRTVSAITDTEVALKDLTPSKSRQGKFVASRIAFFEAAAAA